MNKLVLISIQPYWVFLIIARIMGWDIQQEKKVEVRKDFPKDPAWNKVAHIYCSKNRKSFNRIPAQYQPFMERFLGKVIGEFVCDEVVEFLVFENKSVQNWNYYDLANSCLTYEEIGNYIGANKKGYAWNISDLKIYDKPKELGEFCKICSKKCDTCNFYDESYGACYGNVCLTRPPQSWMYIEVLSE